MQRLTINSLVRASVASADVYQPALSIDELMQRLPCMQITKLGSNENPSGLHPAVMQAILQVLPDLNRYADSTWTHVRVAIAQYYQLTKEHVILGNGSAEVLSILGHTFIEVGDEILSPDYSFCLFKIITQLMGGQYKTVPLDHWFVSVEKLIAAITPKTKIIYLAAPNNPTGTWMTHAEVEYLLQQVPDHVLVVLDEAYAEYNTRDDKPDSIVLVQRYPQLILTRTFSKAFGLAGLRVGYGIAHPDIIRALNGVRLSFNLNSVAAAAAIASLKQPEFLQQSILQNHKEKRRIEAELKSWNVDYIPSATNFITMDIHSPATVLYHEMLAKGVITRTLGNYNMPNHLSVTIGTQEENNIFLSLFKTLYVDKQHTIVIKETL